jgi:hypothetical protein
LLFLRASSGGGRCGGPNQPCRRQQCDGRHRPGGL